MKFAFIQLAELFLCEWSLSLFLLLCKCCCGSKQQHCCQDTYFTNPFRLHYFPLKIAYKNPDYNVTHELHYRFIKVMNWWLLMPRCSQGFLRRCSERYK